MKAYIYCSWLDSHRFKDHGIPFAGGFCINWYKYNTDPCPDDGYRPRGNKKGRHIVTFTLTFMYWTIQLTLYKPKLNVDTLCESEDPFGNKNKWTSVLGEKWKMK